MPKLRLIGLTLLALSATAVSHAEETRYVSDELNTGSAAVREIIIALWVPSTPARKSRSYRAMPTMVKLKTVLVVLLDTVKRTEYHAKPAYPRAGS